MFWRTSASKSELFKARFIKWCVIYFTIVVVILKTCNKIAHSHVGVIFEIFTKINEHRELFIAKMLWACRVVLLPSPQNWWSYSFRFFPAELHDDVLLQYWAMNLYCQNTCRYLNGKLYLLRHSLIVPFYL